MSSNPSALQIAPAELAAWRRSATPPVVVDVREPWELEVCSLPDALAIPLGGLPGRLADVPSDRPVVMVCHHGQRSALAMGLLRAHGIDARNLAGGIDAWARAVDPAMPRY